jgi:hypothetical protein
MTKPTCGIFLLLLTSLVVTSVAQRDEIDTNESGRLRRQRRGLICFGIFRDCDDSDNDNENVEDSNSTDVDAGAGSEELDSNNCAWDYSVTAVAAATTTTVTVPSIVVKLRTVYLAVDRFSESAGSLMKYNLEVTTVS